MSELVSVIVPVHDGARFLREAIDSILAQQHRPLEIIVVNDGSTDDSAAIAQSYGDPVRVLHQANAGPSAARNAGIAAARGSFLTFLDSDDLWVKGKLASQIAFMHSRPEVELCLGLTENFWEAELADEAAAYADHPMSRPYPGHTAAAILRASALARMQPFPEDMRHGEVMVWFENAKAAGVRIEQQPEVMARRRLHAANMTRLERDQASEGMLRLLQLRLRNRRAGQS